MKNKIFVGLAVVILLAGIIVAIWGFNIDISYKSYNLVDVKIGKDFNIKDIRNITNEVFGKQNVEIQRAGVYSDNIALKVNEITDEQKNNLNSKINEKYGLQNSVDDIQVNYIPSYRLRDIVKPYIIPLVSASVIVLAYMLFKYRKIGFGKVLAQVLGLSIIAELLFAAIIAITRYPVDRLVMPGAIIIYMSILTVLTGIFEKQIHSESEK